MYIWWRKGIHLSSAFSKTQRITGSIPAFSTRGKGCPFYQLQRVLAKRRHLLQIVLKALLRELVKFMNNHTRLFKRQLILTQDSKLTKALIFLVTCKNFFHCLCLVYFDIVKTPNWRTNNVNRKPHHKVKKLKSKSSLILGWLHCALNNPAQLIKFFYAVFKMLTY